MKQCVILLGVLLITLVLVSCVDVTETRGRTKRSPITYHRLLDYDLRDVSDPVDDKDPQYTRDLVHFDTKDGEDVTDLYDLRDPGDLRDPNDVNLLDLIRAHGEDLHNLFQYGHDLFHAHLKEFHNVGYGILKEILDKFGTKRKDKMPVPLSAFEGNMCPTGWARLLNTDSCVELD